MYNVQSKTFLKNYNRIIKVKEGSIYQRNI